MVVEFLIGLHACFIAKVAKYLALIIQDQKLLEESLQDLRKDLHDLYKSCCQISLASFEKVYL